MKYDAIVIGAGQGGSPLARALADLGWTVAFVEERHLGGTCINTGCTPTKTMVHRALVAHYARNAARWGVIARDVHVDLPAIVAQKDKVVQSFVAGNEKQAAIRPTLHLYRSHARFTGPHSVAVDGAALESEKIFIDTGVRPRILDIPGLASSGYLTNETIIQLTDLPKHLVILGGGYIGLEFAQMFARFGSQVTVIHNAPQIVPREDPEVAAELQKALEAEGLRFVLNARATRVESASGSISVSVDAAPIPGQVSPGQVIPSVVTGSHLLVASGRSPNTDDLGLDKAGIATNARGFVKVNAHLETNVPGVWALGDVNGGPEFTHISYNDYQIIWGNLIEGKNLSTENRIVPYCLFTDPELGSAGMTERSARQGLQAEDRLSAHVARFPRH